MSPSNAYWGTGESSSRFAIKCRATPFFWRSALTRRRKGMLSCGRKSFIEIHKVLAFPADVTRDSPYSSPNGSSATHAQTVSPRSAASPGPYGNIPLRTQPTGPRSVPESVETRLRQSGTSLRACMRHQRLRNSTSSDPPVIAFPISPYGGRPVNSSITVHPRDQMSDFVDAPLSSMTSGAIQFGVPWTSLISRSIARRLSDTPKSDSFTLPVFVVRMLAALRSQCTTSLWCR